MINESGNVDALRLLAKVAEKSTLVFHSDGGELAALERRLDAVEAASLQLFRP